MTFGKMIKIIREQLNNSQEQLIQELNISFSTINRWENGHTSPGELAKIRLFEFEKK